MLSNRCWPTTFYTITAGDDADGWRVPVMASPQSTKKSQLSIEPGGITIGLYKYVGRTCVLELGWV
jgi:hypothetical protein